jgi:hypothetical protein
LKFILSDPRSFLLAALLAYFLKLLDYADTGTKSSAHSKRYEFPLLTKKAERGIGCAQSGPIGLLAEAVKSPSHMMKLQAVLC